MQEFDPGNLRSVERSGSLGTARWRDDSKELYYLAKEFTIVLNWQSLLKK